MRSLERRKTEFKTIYCYKNHPVGHVYTDGNKWTGFCNDHTGSIHVKFANTHEEMEKFIIEECGEILNEIDGKWTYNPQYCHDDIQIKENGNHKIEVYYKGIQIGNAYKDDCYEKYNVYFYNKEYHAISSTVVHTISQLKDSFFIYHKKRLYEIDQEEEKQKQKFMGMLPIKTTTEEIRAKIKHINLTKQKSGNPLKGLAYFLSFAWLKN